MNQPSITVSPWATDKHKERKIKVVAKSCIVCWKPLLEGVRGRYCSEKCRKSKLPNCDKCGRKHESRDSVFCPSCRETRMKLNEKIIRKNTKLPVLGKRK